MTITGRRTTCPISSIEVLLKKNKKICRGPSKAGKTVNEQHTNVPIVLKSKALKAEQFQKELHILPILQSRVSESYQQMRALRT